MSSRDNKGKDKINNTIIDESPSREEVWNQNEETRKIYADIESLKKSVEHLKNDDFSINAELSGRPGSGKGDGLKLEDTEEIIAAKKAIIQQARKDAEEAKIKEQVRIQKELEERKAQKEMAEAEKRVAMIEKKAEEKRQEALEVERKIKEASRKKALDEMEAELKARNLAKEKNLNVGEEKATPEEIKEFFDEDEKADQSKEIEEAKEELLSAQKHQDVVLGRISHITELQTEKLAEEQQKKLTKQHELIQAEKEKLQEMLDEHKSERLEREAKIRKEIELRQQRAKLEKLIKEERAEAAKEEKRAKIKKKQEERRRKAEARELNRRKKKEAAEKARRERELFEKKSIADAELGGGVVNVKGVTINTKIMDTVHVTLKDFLGFADRKERKETSEAKTRQMREEREKRREEAREAVELSVKQKIHTYEKSAFGMKMQAFKKFCDEHKKVLFTSGAIAVMAIVGIAGVFNYYTAYEYSYNGKALGLVKEKDDVLRITDLVQNALTEERNVDVVIDASDDIEFKRVAAVGDVKIDNSEEVLKRLTYMGDLNVKAYGIYIDGKKAGAVESKEAAANVIQDIKDRYTSGREGAKIEEAVFLENVDIRKSNTDLQDISSEKEMVETLCTNGEKETLHKVVAGETLADIAKFYSLEEDDILDDNPDVDPKKLEVGSTLVIKQNAPMLTVMITELVTYEKEVEFQVQEKGDPDIYEGYTEVQQKGENGLNEVTSRITLVNGEEKEEEPLVTTVKKKPVDKIVLVGTKERPPSVGSGKYIWPMEGGYTITSKFGARWGRQHEGIDLGCTVGSDVLAADGGVVTYSGYNGAYGYLIIVDHQNGMETRYAHNSKLLVSEGDEVFQGQHIAESGNSGRSTGPHLHFEIRVNGTAKNPLNYLP